MAPGKTYIHKMEASELAELNESPFIVVWWGPNAKDLHNPNNIIYNRYPAKVLEAFSDAFGENVKVAEFAAWPRLGVVKVVLDWMLACCTGEGLQPVKDIEIDLTGMVSAKDDGDFSRYFKTAHLLDFAQEYKIKHLEDKLKRELEFQARGKFSLRVEEIYDMANYFWQPNRDNTAIKFMVDSIARALVKESTPTKRKFMYKKELEIWKSDSKDECDCEGEEFCCHDDLAEMVERRVEYFEKPEHAEELNEEFGKKPVEDVAVSVEDWDDGGGPGALNGANDWETPVTNGDRDKENQAPGAWADEANEAANGNNWDAAAGPAGGW